MERVHKLEEEFFASNHDVAPLTLLVKRGESHSRNMSRPLRRRTFTVGTVSPNWRETSSVESCSISRSITTARYFVGSPQIPLSTSCPISDLDYNCSGLSSHPLPSPRPNSQC